MSLWPSHLIVVTLGLSQIVATFAGLSYARDKLWQQPEFIRALPRNVRIVILGIMLCALLGGLVIECLAVVDICLLEARYEQAIRGALFGTVAVSVGLILLCFQLIREYPIT